MRVFVHRLAMLAATALILPCGSQGIGDDGTAFPDPDRGTHVALFETHCLKCHSADTQEGGIRLDDLPVAITTIETAERWQKVLNVLNSGEMPPEPERQPDARTKTEFLADLSVRIVAARRTLSDQGRETVLRRLNRREYQHTIRELLDVEIDVSTLPDDKSSGAFDTNGSSLFMSSGQFEEYLTIGRRAAAAALDRWQHSSGPAAARRTHRTEPEAVARKGVAFALYTFYLEPYRRARAWKKAGAKPDDAVAFGFKDHDEIQFVIHEYELRAPYLAQYLSYPKGDQGAWLALGLINQHDCETITIPNDAAPGRYVLRVRIGANEKVAASRKFVEVGILDGRDGATANGFQSLGLYQVTGTPAKPQVLEIPVAVTADGPRQFTFREKRSAEYLSEAERFGREYYVNGVGPDYSLWIDWIEWDGPISDADTEARWQRLFGQPRMPSETDDPRPLLSHFAARAYRGAAPSADDIDRLSTIYVAQRSAGQSVTNALAQSLATVLASPGFLYLTNPRADLPELADGTVPSKTLTPLEYASRLSYFLWSGPPDDSLLEAAASGRLRDPAEIRKHVARMIADPKSLAFAEGFTHQWLNLDRLDFFRFDYKLHPNFDDPTRVAAKQEVYHTFHWLLRNNHDVRVLLQSDFVVINGLLATYYGIEDVTSDPPEPIVGDTFRRVMLPAGSERGGLLGMAAILAMGSDGAQTSPVERGAWVLRKLLNDPPPPAPPNVPQLSRLENAEVDTRTRLRMHQEEPQCAQCHRRIDPIGFGLENFDAAGRWRTEESPIKSNPRKTFPIDPAGQFFGGPEFTDFLSLRERIADRGDDFLRGVIENLFAYGIGRPVSFADRETIDELVAAARDEGAGLADVIQRIVATPELWMR